MRGLNKKDKEQVYANERLNFGVIYLKFGWEFAQHIYTNFEGFLVSFSMVDSDFRSEL
jgi:hypothetical protein